MSIVVRSYQTEAAVSLIEQAFSSTAAASANTYVCVGDVIDTDEQEGFLRGHGTQVIDGKLVATVCGVVERVNKLVYVKTLNSRYTAEQGDVVVGRVAEVGGKRWRVDLKSRQEASLLLSAVHLPGGIQRRRNAEDELNMRGFFREDDLISAEVQSIHQDGSIALHTRSAKYGKLTGGQLLLVPPNLIKRQKQHFHTLEAVGVDLIIGCNGLVWVAPLSPKVDSMDTDDGESTATAAQPPTKAQLENACRISNAVRVLMKLYMHVYPAAILHVYEEALDGGVSLKDMLQPDFLGRIVGSEAQRRANSMAS